MKNLNICITGGCGFIGTNLALRLSKTNKITIIDNCWKSDNNYHLLKDIENITILVEDLTLPEISVNLIKDFDVVYHLADIVSGIDWAFSNEYYIYKTNILINTNVLSACVKNNIKNYIYVGTACSYPKKIQYQKSNNYVKEEDVYPLDPETSYGMSKYLGEYEANLIKEEMNVGILRLHNVYGPYCNTDLKYSQVIPSLIYKSLLNSKIINILGTGEEYRDFVYVDDVVDALILVFKHGMNKGVIQIGSGYPTKIKEVFRSINNVYKQENNSDLIPKYDLREKGDFGRIAILEKAKKILNWEPKTNFNDGLFQTYQYIKNNNIVLSSSLLSIPDDSNLSDPEKGGKTGVSESGSFRNEKHTGLGDCLFQIASVIGLSNGKLVSFPAIKNFYRLLEKKGFKNDNIFRNLNTFDFKYKTKSVGHLYENIEINQNLM